MGEWGWGGVGWSCGWGSGGGLAMWCQISFHSHKHLPMLKPATDPLATPLLCRALLRRVLTAPSSIERLLHVAAFAVSPNAGVPLRMYKPFNPLLGETFEWSDGDHRCAPMLSMPAAAAPLWPTPYHPSCGAPASLSPGFGTPSAVSNPRAPRPRETDGPGPLTRRFVTEQVSHHPPISAAYADGLAHLNGGYQLSAELELRSKLVGMTVQFTPAGHVQLLLPGSGDHFLWNATTLCISNILLGECGPWEGHGRERAYTVPPAERTRNARLQAQAASAWRWWARWWSGTWPPGSARA